MPLALRCRQVTAVEPSPSMVDVLESQAREHGIANLSVVQSRWEDAEVEAADVTLSVHVLYVIQEIELFIRKMEAHSRVKALVALYEAAPQSQIYSLWEQIHGSKRLALPSAPHFREVLDEMEVDYSENRLPAPSPRGFDSPEHALEQIGRRLYLAEDDTKQQGVGPAPGDRAGGGRRDLPHQGRCSGGTGVVQLESRRLVAQGANIDTADTPPLRYSLPTGGENTCKNLVKLWTFTFTPTLVDSVAGRWRNFYRPMAYSMYTMTLQPTKRQ